MALSKAQEGPVNLLPDPKRKVLAFLLEEPQTAGSIASKMNVFESAVRQHLQALENAGLVTSRFEQRGLGRPKKIFALSQSGSELFARKYDQLLDLILKKVDETYGPQAQRALVLSIARDWGSSFQEANNDVSYKERLKAVTQALGELGFATRLEDKEGRTSIVSKNCIILRTAMGNRDLACNKFHSELIRAALKHGKVELQDCMVDGASCCRHVIHRQDRED